MGFSPWGLIEFIWLAIYKIPCSSTGDTWSLKICNAGKTNFRSESSSCGAIFDVSRSREIIASLEAKTSHPDFWQDQEQAQKILQQRKVAEGVIASDAKLARMLSDIETYFHLAEEETDVAQRDSLLHEIRRRWHGVTGLGRDVAADVSPLGGAQGISRHRIGPDSRRRRWTEIRNAARRG